MSQERILKEAAIAEKAVRYQVLVAAAGYTASIVAIPVLPVAIPITAWYWRRYYENLRVILTARELKVHRGILMREEKSIPLEKITDLAVYDGPIMRHMGLKGIKVETAGQSGAGGALVKIVGLEDTDGFRDRVLAQRDRITDRDEAPSLPAAADERTASGELLETVREIRDVLRRMEEGMGRP